jgi:hypothetical protein
VSKKSDNKNDNNDDTSFSYSSLSQHYSINNPSDLPPLNFIPSSSPDITSFPSQTTTLD